MSEPKDPLRLGRELHVRYLTVGELHRDGANVVILTRLIDAETGADAWSDRFEFDATQLENDQVRAAELIERRLWNGILSAAIRHAKANPTLSDPWNVFLRAQDAWKRGEMRGRKEAHGRGAAARPRLRARASNELPGS